MKKYFYLLLISVLASAFYFTYFYLIETKPNNVYETIGAANSSDNQGEEGKFIFAILGDTQGFKVNAKNGALRRSLSQIHKQNPSFIMAVGDLVSSCRGDRECDNKLNDWKKLVGEKFSRVYPAMGNHDRTEAEADASWQKAFELPQNGPEGYSELVYSFNFSNSHFIVLNSQKPQWHQINDEQLGWLRNDLDKNTKENVFVFFHEPAWPVGSKIKESLDKEPQQRDKLWNILAEHDVTAVFSGHEHIYSRRKIDQSVLPQVKNEVYQFIVGNTDTFRHSKPKKNISVEQYYRNKHFVLVEVEGKNIAVKTYSIGGKLVDEFKFSK